MVCDILRTEASNAQILKRPLAVMMLWPRLDEQWTTWDRTIPSQAATSGLHLSEWVWDGLWSSLPKGLPGIPAWNH